jgi:glycosyltransferase involved in cell wall biosynthesis
VEMMEQHKFLILLFYYDRPDIVKHALNSLNELNYENFEIAFIDDGSKHPGELVAKEILRPEILNRVTFYNTNDSVEKKIEQGGSVFGKLANEAILNSDAQYTIMLCDDDAIVSNYLLYLNEYFQLNDFVHYCYSKVYFFNPELESYTNAKEYSTYNHPGSTYTLNHYTEPINPVGKVDASQICWKTSCNKEGNVWFPFPQTRGLDAALYQQLFDKYGYCYPTFTYGQYKGAFSGQLGNRYIDTNNEFNIN